MPTSPPTPSTTPSTIGHAAPTGGVAAVLTAALTAALAVLLSLMGATLAGGPAAARPATAGAPTPATTALTVKVATCDGCEIRLYQAVRGRTHVWQSRAAVVRGAVVTFQVPTARTHGLSMSVRAPWEGSTGFVTMAVVRYAGEAAGHPVTFARTHTKHRGSGCWAGTSKARATLPLRVRRVTVNGNAGPTAGTIAWFGTSRSSWAPMERTFQGVLGAQDVLFCQHP